MSSDCWRARPSSRLLTAARLIGDLRAHGLVGLAVAVKNCTPRSAASSTAFDASAVAMSDFDGTTSVSTAEPPTPTRSTSVTSAPSWAPARAAS